MKLVIASTVGFLLALLMNQFETIHLAMTSTQPEMPHWLDQRYLFLAAWGFPVLAVWGFNARWLPVFLGLRKPSGSGLMAALCACGCGIAAALFGQFRLATALVACRLHRRLDRPESLPKVGKASEDSWGLCLRGESACSVDNSAVFGFDRIEGRDSIRPQSQRYVGAAAPVPCCFGTK